MAVGLTKKRRQTGTTLVEILVVIVVFLIGILAVVQIFPRGFQLLLTTRNNSEATALGRDLVERLKDSPELIPDEIVPVYYSNGNPEINTTLDPTSVDPQGDGITSTGALLNGGVTATRDWMLAAGPNVARRIIGEGHRLPAPRAIGASGSYESYGGLLVLDHGPLAPLSNGTISLVAYANDLTRTFGAPRDSVIDTSSAGQVTLGGTPSFMGEVVRTTVAIAPFQYFVVNPDSSTAAIYVPSNLHLSRTYRIRMSAYVGTTAATKRYDYLSLSVTVPPINDATVSLVLVPLAPLLANTTEVMNGGAMVAVEPESLRVAPQYVDVANRSGASQNKWTTAATLGIGTDTTPLDPFEMKITDPSIGVLLFSPAARNGVVDRPGGTSDPLIAKIDYDVRDWRIIPEDFRIVDAQSATFSLSLQSVKVGSNAGPDGLPNGGLFTASRASADSSPIDPTPCPRDNVVIIDLTTGFEVQRYRTTKMSNGRTWADDYNTPSTGTDVLVSVDKSRGSLTFHDANIGNTNAAGVDPLDVVLIPPTGNPITVDSANRTFRVFYRARQEWAAQILKSASQYTVLNSLPDAANFAVDQCFVGDGTGGTLSSRLYFPASESGHKVTIDRIVSKIGSNAPQILEGQDFVLRRGGNDVTSYAYADLTQAVSGAVFDYTYGTPVQGVKGASLAVRVLWNPEAFTLSADTATNRERANVWSRGWRKSTTETFLRAEETR